MKAIKARELIRFSEKDYNAHNKMINSTVAHQAVQVAEGELRDKAIQAYKNSCPFNSDGCCQIKKDAGECKCDELSDFIEQLNL